MNFRLLPTPRNAQMTGGAVRSSDIGAPKGLHALPAPCQDTARRWLTGRHGPLPLRLALDPALPFEGYSLRVSQQEIAASFSDAPGLGHALARLDQLDEKGAVPCCAIEDSPALPMRGMHFFFANMSHISFDRTLEIIEAMGRWRLNTLVVEYDERFPYRSHPGIPSPRAFTPEQVQEILTRARSLGMEVIPLHQCLGHVNFILRNDAYAHIREEDVKRDQWCPLNPASFDLFRELADEIIETHRPTRYFHIGGDEARRLGQCPRCAAAARTQGAGGLYVEFITRAAEHIKKAGLRPIVWDDMLCHHINVLDRLPRDITLMYWDYWHTRHPSAHFVARPAGRGHVTDKRWDTEWRAELDPVERRTLDVFAPRLDLAKDLPAHMLERFRPYLGDEFPKRVRAFPYLEYYQDQGFEVICAPTASGNGSDWRGMPDFPRYSRNIETFAFRARQAKAAGLVTTMWYPMPWEAYLPGVMYTGQFAWGAAPSTSRA
ncbi:MAG TPA: family 20 glycosylhydrolase [Candidatus Brocadiia bacterium]|nr:family 20 glycosylhydrolase [Candidatus Brocadiia bacterium]